MKYYVRYFPELLLNHINTPITKWGGGPLHLSLSLSLSLLLMFVLYIYEERKELAWEWGRRLFLLQGRRG